MDLSGHVPERLREDGDMILYRARERETRAPVLLLTPASRRTEAAAATRISHELALADGLDPAWAAKPRVLVRYEALTGLVLDDPGGRPLDGILGKPLDLDQFLTIAVNLTAALRQAHAAGLIHKDVKPANILVDDDGKVCLTGFGFATRRPRERHASTAVDGIAGTLAYMAPEQTGRMNRSIDARSDLYALGVTLYEMLAGVLPFTATDPLELIYCHIARQPPPFATHAQSVPLQVDQIVMKLLEKNAEDRYQTAAGIEHDLRRCREARRTNGHIDPFPVAAHERPDRLLIPEKLYGRGTETDMLANVLDQVAAQGRSEFVLVSGYSGSGKSSLVDDLQRHVHAARGLFAVGKVDRQKRDIPYASLSSAFRGLMRQILRQDDAALRHWRTSLSATVGPNGQLIIDLFPELGLVIGSQSSPPVVSPQEARNRFLLVFRRFIGAFARAEHPLILFLDDLQWVDSATLDLLELIAGGEKIPHLLLIGAYRSNEVDQGHPLRRTLDKIRTSRGGDLKEIRLEPLLLPDVCRLVAETLRTNPLTVRPLAELIVEKTHGNPFFVVEFLTMLNTEGLLVFDGFRGAWRWDIDQIRAKGITDNVVDLMAAKLIRYKGLALKVIRHLACLGDGARTSTLGVLLGMPDDAVDAALRDFVGAGLLRTVVAGYAFAHDGVRDAAYALIPRERQASTHLKIGRILLKGSGAANPDDELFEIVNQLNRGASLIRSPKERNRLAELNLAAGMRAKDGAAHESASAYFTAGCALLPVDSWRKQPRLNFELEFHQADCKFMTGDIAFAEERLALLSQRSMTISDVARIIGRQMILYTYLGREHHAIELCVECLVRMGVSFPVHPPARLVEAEYRLVVEKIGGRTVEDLIDLPVMTDGHWLKVLDVLESLLAPAGAHNPDLQHLVLLRMASISLDHGCSDETAHAFACIGGLIMGWRFGEFKTGHRLGQLAMRLVEERGFDRYAARLYAVVSGTSGPWSMPLSTCYAIAVRASEMGREQGGIVYAGLAWGCAITALLDSGASLAEVHRQAEIGVAAVPHLNYPLGIEFMTTQLMFTRALRGLTSSLASLSNGEFDEEDYKDRLERTPHLWHALVRYRIRKLQLQFHAGNIAACLKLIALLEDEVGPIKVFEIAEYRFFSSLARAAFLSGDPDDDRIAQLNALASSHGQLEVWATLCPENFANRAFLVGAEIARLEGRDLEAQRLYEDAIQSARDNGFVQNEGLANELAARFYMDRGFQFIGEAYLFNARSCFLRWGADAKVRQIDELFPHLRDEVHGGTTVTLREVPRFQHLDLAAVAEMYQAVSGEIVMDRLIERLMTTVVEYAGAVRGLLMLPREGELRIVAEAITDESKVSVTLRPQADSVGELPQSILNFVSHTKDAVIVDDARKDSRYAADPYVIGAKLRSILCLPLVKQNSLVGILYLDNNLSSYIFTPDRLSVLRLLASQAAISIENAELFLDVQRTQEVARQAGEELRASFDMIPALAWRTSPNGEFEFANKQWHDYTGQLPEDTTPSSWLGAFHPDDREKVAEKWRQLLRSGAAGEVEARMRRFDGEYRVFLVRATPMRDERGDVVKWHGTNTDIENLKRAEEAQEAFGRVSRITAMGELTVSIAHEVNQPLMAIVTNAATCLRWLSEEQLNVSEARIAAERIIRDGHRAGDVIASIRALAKKSSFTPTALQLKDIIHEVLVLTRNELDRHAITVETDLSQGTASIVGDRVQMQQVLLNLIMNGIEAINLARHEPRMLRISTRCQEPGFVQVSISDTGVGLAETGSERIFDVFYTTKPDGIGIGLSICRSIVEAHHGRLWATPNKPHGTAFSFTVPIFLVESPR